MPETWEQNSKIKFIDFYFSRVFESRLDKILDYFFFFFS